MSAVPPTDGGSGVEGEGSAGQPAGLRLPLKSPPPLQPLLPRSSSPPSSQQPQQPQQPQQQPSHGPHSPRSPRDRVRRAGHSPLAVVINPPSLDNENDAGSGGGGGVVDSLSLALEELRATGSAIVGLPQPKPAAGMLVENSSAVCALPPTESHVFNGSCGSSVGSRSDEEFLSVRPVAKRSSSLKSKKTPPGTPSQTKKAVRFADAFGLDLANVKHVLDPENPPEIPPQATRDLELGDDDEDDKSTHQRESASSAAQPSEPSSPTAAPPGPQSPMNEGDDERRLTTSGGSGALCAARPAFSQPGHSAGFGARVMAQKVVLESAGFAATPPEIRGYVRVVNLAFEKSVSLRVTFDGWRSSAEAPAAYVPDSSSGMTDQFAFSVAVPAHALRQPGVARIAFCVAYNVGGQTFWDNNFGENYAFDCVPTALLADSRGQRL